jgi:hypothetical protein
METKEELKESLVDLLEKAPAAEVDRWRDYFKDINNEALLTIPREGNADKVLAETSVCALHFGMMFLHHGNHPLWKHLTQEERDDVVTLRDAFNRVFATQKDGGVYGKFFAGAAAAR